MNIESKNQQQLWEAFLERWPIESLKTMVLDDFSAPASDDSFCYWLESKTESLGSIWGGSAFKFGVYARKDKTEKINGKGRCYNANYGWMAKYGTTPEEAFEAVKIQILAVVEAARAGDLKCVDTADLGEAVRWKLAFLYQDRNHLSIAPVFKGEYVRILVNDEKNPLSVCHNTLIKELGERNIFDYAGLLWERVNEVLNNRVTTEKAKDYFDNSELYSQIKQATDYIAGYQTEDGNQLALDLSAKKKVTLYLSSGSWLEKIKFPLNDLVNYAPDKSRHSNLRANAPKLWTGNPAVQIKLSTMKELLELSEVYASMKIEREPVTPEHKSIKVSQPPLNQILFGPPGTGKTYHTINKALEILAPDFLINHLGNDEETRSTLKQRFDELVTEGRIRFTTFHQSFSYEDFVEGLKAETDDVSGQIRYEVVDGIFKSLCVNADIASTESGKSFEVVVGELIEKIEAAEGRIKMKTLRGKFFDVEYNGGPTFRVFPHCTENADSNHIASMEHVKRLYMGESKNGMYNSSYVEGMLRYLQSHCGLPLTPSVELHSTKRAPFVLIIDEINRGNVSRIFGELITLIEPSKRQGREEALSVVLPYSKMPFSVPNNIYIIGTMNTADRSLAGLDIALRRRFSFTEMPPKPELLEDVFIDTQLSVSKMLNVMNQRISVLLDKDHCLGHAYFMPLQKEPTLEKLGEIFKQNIIPLLQEYFFEDWERIRWVLNDQNKALKNAFVVEDESVNLVSLFSGVDDRIRQAPQWHLNESAFNRLSAYEEIISIENI